MYSVVTRRERSLAAWIHLDIPEVWLRFLLAVAGLALAFAAAISSTLARESGSVMATAGLAAAALLLAGLVGLTTVPYLARRVAVRQIRDAFDYEVTRAGLLYLALAMLLGLAAVNTGNNLLWIIVAAMLAAVVVSGVASALVLRGLQLEIRVPDRVFAKRTITARVIVRNTRRILPCFSVAVVRPKQPRRAKSWNWEKSEFEFPSRAPSRRPWIRLPDRVLRRENHSEGATLLSGAVYFPYVPAKNSLSADVNLCFPRRGVVRQESFGLATSFPFSFLRKTRYLALSREIIVFPPVEPTDELLELLPVITGEFEAFVRGRGYDLYRIRQYAPEDSARHVDWKASAKTGNLLVREFTREDERRLRVVFDNPAPGGISEAAYERAVALTASLGWHFAGRATQLSFVAPGYAGSSDIYEFLRYLAVVQPGKQNSVLSNLPLSDDYNLIFTSRPRGSIPTSLWARSYFLFMQDEGKPAAMPDTLSAPLAT